MLQTTTSSPRGSPANNKGFYLDRCTQEQAYQYFYSWSVKEQGNPGAQGHDIRDVFFKIDPNGFFLGKVPASSQSPEQGTPGQEQQQSIKHSADDKVVSIVSAVRYPSGQGWIGYYLVDPDYRDQGSGLEGVQKCLEHLDGCASIGLDSAMAQVENYKELGFVHVGWQNERRYGSALNLVYYNVDVKEMVQEAREGETEGMINIEDAPVEGLAALEQQYTGLNRPDFVRDWAQFHGLQHAQSGRYGAAVMDHDGKTVLGFGCVRRAESSYRIGPLYATSGEIAKKILIKLAVDVVDGNEKYPQGIPLMINIDIPNSNPQAVAIMNRLGWANTLTSSRVWRGSLPEADVNGVFAICTVEVG
ncbi:hypothetical protein EDD21DRAFT_376223 [Dissophora ornata]|nr:hypothetical protein BGZ58_002792 [Dissophora ornata]KAI8600786.1 hypothetical protein EDD21DRAFT_376223 [Dissophora ornata]